MSETAVNSPWMNAREAAQYLRRIDVSPYDVALRVIDAEREGLCTACYYGYHREAHLTLVHSVIPVDENQ